MKAVQTEVLHITASKESNERPSTVSERRSEEQKPPKTLDDTERERVSDIAAHTPNEQSRKDVLLHRFWNCGVSRHFAGQRRSLGAPLGPVEQHQSEGPLVADLHSGPAGRCSLLPGIGGTWLKGR
ncbi:hypothetical protein SRHO_G00118840 [Serrasalmus rhombeus]